MGKHSPFSLEIPFLLKISKQNLCSLLSTNHLLSLSETPRKPSALQNTRMKGDLDTFELASIFYTFEHYQTVDQTNPLPLTSQSFAQELNCGVSTRIDSARLKGGMHPSILNPNHKLKVKGGGHHISHLIYLLDGTSLYCFVKIKCKHPFPDAHSCFTGPLRWSILQDTAVSGSLFLKE